MAEENQLVTLTADIVSAHVAHNNVAVGDLRTLIANVHNALSGLGQPQEQPPVKTEPRVSIRSSVKPDHIVCLFDGSKHKMLKRHLQQVHAMTPREYREEFGLKDDYPMVAPEYSERRRGLAKAIGLGTFRKKAAPSDGTAKGRAKSSGRRGGKKVTPAPIGEA